MYRSSYRTPTYRRGFFDRFGLWGLAIIGVVLVIAATLGYGALLHGTERNVTTVVNHHERVCESGGGNCKYLVYTDDGTFKDTDSIWYGKFRSSDLYGELVDGHSYTFKVAGWRVPFFSTYPNIIEIEADNGPTP